MVQNGWGLAPPPGAPQGGSKGQNHKNFNYTVKDEWIQLQIGMVIEGAGGHHIFNGFCCVINWGPSTGVQLGELRKIATFRTLCPSGT